MSKTWNGPISSGQTVQSLTVVKGENKLLNGDFETDPSVQWSVTDCTIASTAGGLSGNCCTLTRTGGANQYMVQSITAAVGQGLIFEISVKSGTAGDVGFHILIYSPSGNYAFTGSSTDAWVTHSFPFIARHASMDIMIYKLGTAAGTILFDSASVKQQPTINGAVSSYTTGIAGEFTQGGDVADDASFNLPQMVNGGMGLLVAGVDEERAQFSIKSDGTVNLIVASANVVANADTDGKVCIGTSVASPCVVKNRLGSTKAVLLQLWYN